MSTLTIQLPDSVEIERSDLLRMIAARLYERGVLSLGRAAEVADMSKWAFAEILPDYGVSVINYPASELAEDLEHA